MFLQCQIMNKNQNEHNKQKTKATASGKCDFTGFEKEALQVLTTCA